MRERELLLRLVAALDAGPTTPDTIAELVGATEAARAELARPVPGVDEAWAEVEDEMHWFRLDEPGAQGAGLKATIRSYAQAVATAAVERHRELLGKLIDWSHTFGEELCPGARPDSFGEGVRKCKDQVLNIICAFERKTAALLADAQKAG